MSGSRTIRTVILIIMDLLVVLAVLVTARVIVVFFGSLAAQAWAKSLVAVTNPLVRLSLFSPVKTPYGGVFDIPAVIVVLVLLAAEWVLSGLRSRS